MLELVLLLLIGIPFVSAEVFTSIHEVREVFRLEQNFVRALKKYHDKEAEKLEKIKLYLQEYEAVEHDISQDFSSDEFGNFNRELTAEEDMNARLDRVAGNPIHTFLLMRRLTRDWQAIQSLDSELEWQDVTFARYPHPKSTNQDHLSPEYDDLWGAADSLSELHDVYKLNVSETVKGTIMGVHSSATLSAVDCLFIGNQSLYGHKLGVASDFFKKAYKLAKTSDNLDEIRNIALNFLAETNKMITEAEEEESVVFKGPPFFIRDKDGALYRKGNYDKEYFKALCRGERLMPPEEAAKLHCRLDSRGVPYLLLMPAKVEEHHLSGAGLVTFHEVLTDNEISELVAMASPALTRTTVLDIGVDNHRTSKGAWLRKPNHPTNSVLSHVTRRIQYLTGLSICTEKGHAEDLQVTNHGIGGHYYGHLDLLYHKNTPNSATERRDHRLKGDRIATFMFYLNDVAKGGATVFPRLGASVWSSKGSAVFWYNLRRSGKPYLYTVHGGCPVVLGSKWIANQWIREIGQWDRRPCATESWA